MSEQKSKKARVSTGNYKEGTIASVIKAAILKYPTLSNKELLAKVKSAITSDIRTTEACIAWYKVDLRKAGVIKGSAKAKIEVNLDNL